MGKSKGRKNNKGHRSKSARNARQTQREQKLSKNPLIEGFKRIMEEANTGMASMSEKLKVDDGEEISGELSMPLYQRITLNKTPDMPETGYIEWTWEPVADEVSIHAYRYNDGAYRIDISSVDNPTTNTAAEAERIAGALLSAVGWESRWREYFDAYLSNSGFAPVTMTPTGIVGTLITQNKEPEVPKEPLPYGLTGVRLSGIEKDGTPTSATVELPKTNYAELLGSSHRNPWCPGSNEKAVHLVNDLDNTAHCTDCDRTITTKENGTFYRHKVKKS